MIITQSKEVIPVTRSAKVANLIEQLDESQGAENPNQNCHRITDTADTLNYQFLVRVTRLLTACAVTQAEELLKYEY